VCQSYEVGGRDFGARCVRQMGRVTARVERFADNLGSMTISFESLSSRNYGSEDPDSKTGLSTQLDPFVQVDSS
jgi:hypothetical protein